MADVSDDLIPSVIRQVRADIPETGRDIADVKGGARGVGRKVDGLTAMPTLLAGQVHHAPQRIEALEAART